MGYNFTRNECETTRGKTADFRPHRTVHNIERDECWSVPRGQDKDVSGSYYGRVVTTCSGYKIIN